jgi:hypothetical protein
MTIDKIRHYMGEQLFNHWFEVSKREDALYWINRAIVMLKEEKSKDIVRIAELKLLEHYAAYSN